jgi:hypothetical protein
MRIRTLLILPCLSAVAGCTASNPAFEPPEVVCEEDHFFVAQRFELADPTQVDVLFVVDNSPGMLENQRTLASAMPQFVNRLNAVEGLDWRAGVITTDLSEQGTPVVGPAGQGECPAELPTFVERGTARPEIALACNLIQGEAGSEFEQGFETARRAIEGNAEFLRPNARLVLVFFSDEDDCTAQAELDRTDPNNCVWQQGNLVSVDDFARYFATSARSLSGNPVSVVALVGPRDNRSYTTGVSPEPACAAGTSALSGNRYIRVTETGAIQRYGFFESICSTSYVSVVERIVEDAIDVRDDELCMSRNMVSAPRSVVLTAGDAVELSEFGDYLVTGPTDRCPNGSVAIGADAHNASTGHVGEVRFCTNENPESE